MRCRINNTSCMGYDKKRRECITIENCKYQEEKQVRAKEYLSQIEKINMMIKNKDAEIVKWKELADNTSAPALGDNVKTSGVKDTMATSVVNYVDIENELFKQKQELINKHKEIVQTIEKLPAQEYDVLHMIYIQLRSLEDVAEYKHKSYRWVTAVHGRALSNVQRILNKKQNDDKNRVDCLVLPNIS